jgi:hypothetical protein
VFAGKVRWPFVFAPISAVAAMPFAHWLRAYFHVPPAIAPPPENSELPAAP